MHDYPYWPTLSLEDRLRTLGHEYPRLGWLFRRLADRVDRD
jgi:hypothetical protein